MTYIIEIDLFEFLARLVGPAVLWEARLAPHPQPLLTIHGHKIRLLGEHEIVQAVYDIHFNFLASDQGFAVVKLSSRWKLRR